MVSKNREIYGFLCWSQVLITMVPRNINKWEEKKTKEWGQIAWHGHAKSIQLPLAFYHNPIIKKHISFCPEKKMNVLVFILYTQTVFTFSHRAVSLSYTRTLVRFRAEKTYRYCCETRKEGTPAGGTPFRESLICCTPWATSTTTTSFFIPLNPDILQTFLLNIDVQS